MTAKAQEITRKSALALSPSMVMVAFHRMLIPDQRLLEQSRRLRTILGIPQKKGLRRAPGTYD